jgi:hypothetical protein
MVHGMIAIVEAQVIERFASKVARKIVLGAHIAAIVLEEVQ